MQQLTKKQKMLARLKRVTLMDDEFMTRFFQDDKERTQFVLNTILGNRKIEIVEEVSQKVVKSLLGRSVRLDVFARDAKGRPYDIEIQRADKGAGAKRARYYSALMDADETVPNMEPENLPESYIIFITEHDIFKKGFPLYHIERVINETGKPFNDKMHIIYVNGQYRGDDPIGWLMHDFNCTKASDMKNEILAEKVRYIKESDNGVTHMGRVMEEFAKEEREEERIETAAKLIKSGDMTENRVKEFFKFTEEQMQAVKTTLNALK